MARPSAEVEASYKSDDDIRRRRRNGNGAVVGGEITSSYNPRLQSGQDKKGIGTIQSPAPKYQVESSASPKYQVTSPKNQVTSPKNPPSSPLRRSASVGDWQRKYLFLEDPEARSGDNQEVGARDSFVEQQPVTGRTFDPLALREVGHLVPCCQGVSIFKNFISSCPQVQKIFRSYLKTSGNM